MGCLPNPLVVNLSPNFSCSFITFGVWMLIQRDVPFKHAVLYTATGVRFGLKIACSLEFRRRLSKNVTHMLHQAKNCGLNSFSSFYCLPCWQTSVTENSRRLEISEPPNVPNDFFRLLQVRANDLSNDLRKRNGCLLSGCIHTALIMSLDIHKWHQYNSILTERQRGGGEKIQRREGRKKRLKEGSAGNCRFVFLMAVLSGRGKILSPTKQEKRASTTHLTAKLFCYLMIPFREPLCSLPGAILCQINTLIGPSYPSSLWNTMINVPYLQISLF